MTLHTACSFWVASAAATLRGWHVMGVRIHGWPCKCAHCMRESQHAFTPLPTLLPSSPPWPGGGRGRGRRGKVDVRQRSCATHNAMPKLHFAAPGAVCIHFLALSSSFCIWSRLCALLAQLVHNSSRQVSTHRNRLGQPARQRFSPIYDINSI